MPVHEAGQACPARKNSREARANARWEVDWQRVQYEYEYEQYRSHRGVPPHERDGHVAKTKPLDKKKELIAARNN